jgi:predicted pyridoxine 5'-phosphate oxidase superfamily flavin-nucleotide-binding protein
VALLFMIPGSGTTLRVNGRAHLSTEPDLVQSFVMEGKVPRTVVVIAVESVYFQCARAIIRSDLWNPAKHVAADSLPSAGQILAALSNDRVGGVEYDRAWCDRARQTLW